MKNILAFTIIILLVFGCQKEDFTPTVKKSMEFSVEAAPSAADVGTKIAIVINRLGDYDFETNAVSEFYISKDETYSANDMLLTPGSYTDYNIIFEAGVNDFHTHLELTPADPIPNTDNYYLIARLVPADSSKKSVRYCSTPVKLYLPDANVTFTGLDLYKPYYSGNPITTFDKGSTIYTQLNYNSISDYKLISYDFYISTDDKLELKSDLKVSSNEDYVFSGNGTYLNDNFTLPGSLNAGTYYMIVLGQVSYSGEDFYINQVFQKILIK